VAIRKVVGAKRKQLIIQFLGESVFLTLIAIVLSLGLVEIMLPVFESVIGKSLSPDYSSPVTLVSLILLFIVTGMSGGLYPSLILSGFKPGSILKANQSKETGGSITIRNILVIFQFIISIIIIIAAIAVYAQLKYSLDRDPGYNRENLLIINKINLYPGLSSRVELFKSELKKISGVTDVSLSEIQPSQKIKNDRVYTLPGAAETSHLIFASGVCYDYFKTYQIPVIAGRNYSEGRDLPEPILGMDF
jgi:putative ABC transport system permease protein